MWLIKEQFLQLDSHPGLGQVVICQAVCNRCLSSCDSNAEWVVKILDGVYLCWSVILLLCVTFIICAVLPCCLLSFGSFIVLVNFPSWAQNI